MIKKMTPSSKENENGKNVSGRLQFSTGAVLPAKHRKIDPILRPSIQKRCETWECLEAANG